MDKAHILLGRNVKVLNMGNNSLKNVCGIERLNSLESLYIGYNRIASVADVSGIAILPRLMNLELKGNPLIKKGVKMSYHYKILNLMKESRLDKNDKQLTFRDLIKLLPIIDGIQVTEKELVALHNSTYSTSLGLNQGRKLTTRISQRTVVKIFDKNSTTDCNDSFLRPKCGRYKKKNVPKEGSSSISDMYPTLENVLKSINLNKQNYHNQPEVYPNPTEGSEIVVEAKKSMSRDEIDDITNLTPSGSDIESILDQIDAAMIDPIILYEKIERCADINESTDKIVNGSMNDQPSNAIEVLAEQLSEENNEINHMNVSLDNNLKITEEKKVDFAEAERSSHYDGPESYCSFLISSDLQKYFEFFVFPETGLPRIQLYQTDRDLMTWTLEQNKDNYLQESHEKFISVSSEKVIPCGIAATGRITPIESEARDIHGNILKRTQVKMSECHDLLLCISNKAMYLIPDMAKGSSKSDRQRFPAPLPNQAKFEDAMWPHAYCRHPLKFLKKIRFDGFGFQRLTLYFKLPRVQSDVYVQPENGLLNPFDYTYVIFSCNRNRTMHLISALSGNGTEVQVQHEENDLPAEIKRALAPKVFHDDIRHYQILTQIWDNNNVGSRRAFILTNESIFLFHETYTGDRLDYDEILNDDTMNCENGNLKMRTVKSTKLCDISNISVSNDDSRKVVLSFKANKPPRCKLLCKDAENADELIKEVRKAMADVIK